MKTIVMKNPATTGQQFLMLPTNRRIELIDTSTIIRIEAISNYSKLFFANNKTLVVAKLLRWFEECLGSDSSLPGGEERGNFLRIHRTHLVNRNFIQYYQSGKIKLLNGELIDVAKRKKTYFLKWWTIAA